MSYVLYMSYVYVLCKFLDVTELNYGALLAMQCNVIKKRN